MFNRIDLKVFAMNLVDSALHILGAITLAVTLIVLAVMVIRPVIATILTTTLTFVLLVLIARSLL